MSNTNDFVPFCYQDTGTNLEEQADYLVDPDRTIGNQPGIASSQLNNKALRQGTYVASTFAQFISNFVNVSTLDDANQPEFLAQVTAGLMPMAPVLTALLTGSGSWNPTYFFYLSSGNATVGATYTNNGQTFTVVNTISAGSLLQTTGTGAPASASGGSTLTKASGTGDATITYYAFRSSLYVKVKAVGGGGGGGSVNGGAGSTGGTTTLGSIISLTGGVGGTEGTGYGPAPAGGTVTTGVGFVGVALNGATGSPGQGLDFPGGGGGAAAQTGGVSPFGGAGGGGSYGGSGNNAVANSGSGGGGASYANTPNTFSGGGGGAGAYVDGIIPSAPYTYTIATAGAGGSGGSENGGNGGTGAIYLEEHFQ